MALSGGARSFQPIGMLRHISRLPSNAIMNFVRQVDPASWPKTRVELHLHLDCSVRLSTVWELAQKKKIKLEDCKTLEDLKKKVVRTRPGTLGSFIAPTSLLFPAITGDAAAIERVAYELCEDQANEGVAYFEARLAPRFWTTGDITPEEVVKSVWKGFQRGQTDYKIQNRMILCCVLGFEKWSAEVAEMCTLPGVVGIDIAGDEEKFPDLAEEHIKAFKRAAELGVGRTAHASEVGPASHALRAINVLGVSRIGHGYRAVEDADTYSTLKEKNIHFEACPCSSLLTGAVPLNFKEHPIVTLGKDNANFSINKDDTAMIGNTLDDDYALLREYGMNESYIIRANLNAAKAAFLPDKEKQELLKLIRKNLGLD